MGTIQAAKTTIIKAKNVASDLLEKSQILTVKEGEKLAIQKVTDDKNQHAKIILASPLLADDETSSLQEVYGYEPHWIIPPEMMPREVKLAAKYRSQLDNFSGDHGTPYRQCALTSRAIALDWALKRFGQEGLDERAAKEGFREGEGWYGRVLKKYGDTTIHAFHTKAFKEFDVDSYFTMTASLSDLIEALECQMCVPISVGYKSSGHVICVVGYNPEQKFFWIHDPYGCRAGSADYYSVRGGNAGAFDKYSLDVMRDIWGDRGNKDSGWAHFITAVANQPTGVRSGM